MRRLPLILLVVLLCAPVVAQEAKLTLATPVAKSTTEFSIRFFLVEAKARRITIAVDDNLGESKRVEYPNATVNQAATNTFLQAIRNFDKSAEGMTFDRWLLKRLQDDGFLGAGTFSGGN